MCKALTNGVLGDVNDDGLVNLDDALLLTAYVVDGSVWLINPFLGDVNGDGLVNMADALLLIAYVVNPADPSLPAGIGQAVSSSSAGSGFVVGAIRRLTTHSENDSSPSWSPDGVGASIDGALSPAGESQAPVLCCLLKTPA